jgi:hypothetical protein
MMPGTSAWNILQHIEKRECLYLPFRGSCQRYGGGAMSSISHPIDLAQVPVVPWVWVDEQVYAAIRGFSVKILQRERQLNVGCAFRRVNGTSIQYKRGDIFTFERGSQHQGTGVRKFARMYERSKEGSV